MRSPEGRQGYHDGLSEALRVIEGNDKDAAVQILQAALTIGGGISEPFQISEEMEKDAQRASDAIMRGWNKPRNCGWPHCGCHKLPEDPCLYRLHPTGRKLGSPKKGSEDRCFE